MSKVCEYYLSPISTWAYLGHARLEEMAKRHGVTVDVKPIEFGKVLSVSGGLPLSKRSPQRQAYRLLEIRRWGQHLQIPINPQPKFFPVSVDAAARLIIAAKVAAGGEAALRLTGALLRALWAEERNIGDNDTLVAIALEAELEGRMLLKASETASVQAEYERNTEEAIAANVFGSPWYVVDGEGYWGQDRLDFVERAFAESAG